MSILNDRKEKLATQMLDAAEAGDMELLKVLYIKAESLTSIERAFAMAITPEPRKKTTQVEREKPKGKKAYSLSELAEVAKDNFICHFEYKPYGSDEDPTVIEFDYVGKTKPAFNGKFLEAMPAFRALESLAGLEEGKIYAFRSSILSKMTVGNKK